MTSPIPGFDPGLSVVHARHKALDEAEVVLLIVEPSKAQDPFRKMKTPRLGVKNGLVHTAFGSVFWTLFMFTDPRSKETFSYEATVNPKDTEHTAIFTELANQQWWHPVITNDAGFVRGSFEIRNTFGLATALNSAQAECADRQVSDFMAAKAEYERRYTIQDLINLKGA